MGSIFLSASVPKVGRGNYHETSNPFLIQCAVRELIINVIRTKVVVWGGHPAITPMIWSICEDLGVHYAESVVLYQSRYFEDRFPDESRNFGNVNFVEAVANDREASLVSLRETMLARSDLTAAVFIGGMEGVEAEFDLFRYFHPTAKVLLVGAPGGAARQLAERLGISSDSQCFSVDFARLFHSEFGSARSDSGK